MATDTLTKSPGILWDHFLKRHPTHADKLQGLIHETSPQKFKETILSIVGKDASTEDFVGLLKDVQDMHHAGEESHEEKHQEENPHEEKAHEAAHTSPESEEETFDSILSLFKKPKFMEEDPKFWEMVAAHQKKWDTDNPAPPPEASEEEKLAHEQKQVDFTYGSLDDPNSQSAETLAHEQFKKEYGQEGKDAKDVDQKKQQTWKRYVAYKTTPTVFDKDKEAERVQRRIAAEGEARRVLLQKSGLKGTDLDQSYSAVMERIKKKQWDAFVKAHEEKAAAYAKEAYTSKDEHKKEAFAVFKKSHEAWEKEKEAAAENSVEQHQAASLPVQETPAAAPPPPAAPAAEAKPLTQEEILERDLAELKEKMAREKSHVPQPPPPTPIASGQASRLSSSNPASFQHTPTRIPPPSHPPASPAPAQGQSRPGGAYHTPQQPSRPPLSSQGQSRPMFPMGFRLPRWRNPSHANPASARPFIRNAPVDRLNSGLSNGINTLRTGVQAANTLRNILTSARFLGILGPWLPWIIIGILLLLIILTISGLFGAIPSMNFTVSPAPTPAASSTTTSTIPGLTLTLTGPTAVANSENIQYTIDASYAGTADVTLTDTFPPNTSLVSATGTNTKTTSSVSWKLSDNDGGSNSPKTYSFTIVLRSEKEDIEVKNKIVATATGGGGFLSGGSGNACTAQYEGTGYCSVENLKQYFGGDGGKALVASMICQTESRSSSLALNTKCPDYSVGLFQINAIAHCPGAYSAPARACIVADVAKRTACETAWSLPEENIKQMLRISNNGTVWTPWSAYTDSAIGARKRLAECGIN